MILFYIISLLSLSFTVTDASNNNNNNTCVQPQYYWLNTGKENWSSDILSKNLCGSSWYDLMKVETVQLMVPESNFWFVIFHQLCTASLNSPRPLEINSIISLVLDNLERGCSNITKWSQQWQNDENIFFLYNQLYAFNTGELNSSYYPSCSSINNSNNVDFFSFANLTDLFLVVLPTNETVPAGSHFFASVVAHIFRLSSTFIAFTAATAVLILVVSVMWAIYFKKMKYSFYWTEPDPYLDLPTDEDEINLTMTESDTDDHQIQPDEAILVRNSKSIVVNVDEGCIDDDKK